MRAGRIINRHYRNSGSERVSASAASTKAAASASTGIAPKSTSMMDCNGHSPKYHEVRQDMVGGCTDPRGTWNGRFEDNGTYVGHDEPSIKFISSAPGSGNNMTYVNRLGVDPKGKPTVSPNAKKTVSDYAELSPAPWFGLPICDPGSYPQNPCKPDSDSNSGAIRTRTPRVGLPGAPVLPAGLPAVRGRASCDARPLVLRAHHRQPRVGVQLRDLNTACEEPVNFAFLQRNGVPAGPPARSWPT